MFGDKDHDCDLIGKGPMALGMRYTFFELFSHWEYKANHALDRLLNHHFDIDPDKSAIIPTIDSHPQFATNAPMKFNWSNPDSSAPNPCIAEQVAMINAAKKSILIANLYFTPGRGTMEALKAAAGRGVKIAILTNPAGNTASRITYFFGHSGRRFLNELMIGRTDLVTASFYNEWNVLFHKKITVIDGEELVVESGNIGYKSLLLDNEVQVIIKNSSLAQQAETAIRYDIAEKAVAYTPRKNNAFHAFMDMLWVNLLCNFG